MMTSAKTTYGIRMTVSGFVRPEEMVTGYAALKRLARSVRSYALLVDKREAKPYSPQTAAIVEENMAWLAYNGMGRWAVLCPDQITAMQTSRLTRKSGIAAAGRYFGADDPDWERKALQWLGHGTESEDMTA